MSKSSEGRHSTAQVGIARHEGRMYVGIEIGEQTVLILPDNALSLARDIMAAYIEASKADEN